MTMNEKHTCKLCSSEISQLQRHLTIKHHGILLVEYLEKFNCGAEYQETYQRLRNFRSKNSPWSVEFYVSRGMTQEEAKASINDKIAKKKEKRTTNPAEIGHCLHKWINEIQAAQKVKQYRIDIGSVPTLDKYIIRYGLDQGTAKWNLYRDNINNRQQKFLESASDSLIEAKLIRWFNQSSHKNGKIVREFSYDDFKSYSSAVFTATKLAISLYGDEIDSPNREILGKVHASQGFALDHKYSKYGGFVNKVHPILLGSKQNLQLISKADNQRKGQYCDITLDELRTYGTILDDQSISKQFKDRVSEIFIEKR